MSVETTQALHIPALPITRPPFSRQHCPYCYFVSPEEHDVLEMLPLFQYEPLDRTRKCIRLLEVMRPGDGDLIQCKLRTYRVKDIPPYVALSYTWDRDNRSEHIVCNGMSLKVGRNVWDVLSLYQFRAKISERGGLIWIDAICIDQYNIGERNHQVDQMRDIYSGAEAVIVWLGLMMDDAERAFHLARVLEQPLAMNGYNLRWHTSLEQWKSITHLLERPYWTRVWITQEFILANSVELWCGAHSVSGFGFDRLARWLFSLGTHEVPEQVSQSGLLESPGWRLFRHRTLWWQSRWSGAPSHAFTFRQLLETFSDLQSSDPRDKVYGFLGLTDSSLRADYSKTLVEVVVDTIRNELRQTLAPSPGILSSIARLVSRVLHVSDAQLAVHVLKYTHDLHQRLDVIISAAHMVFPLHHVSTVTCGGITSRQLRYVKEVQKEPTPISDTSGAFSLIRDLENLLPPFTDPGPDLSVKLWDPDIVRLVRDHLQFPLHFHDPRSTVDNRNDVLRRSERHKLGWISIFETGDSLINEDRSVDPGRPRVPRPADCYTCFVGSNGFIGITMSAVSPLDCLFVLPRNGTISNALILRPDFEVSGSVRCWWIVGTAALFRQEFESNLQWHNPPPGTSGKAGAARPGSVRYEEIKDRLAADFSTVSLLARPMDLKALFLCGLLRDSKTKTSINCDGTSRRPKEHRP